MNSLNGKVAVITGASRGLGKSIAALFASEGAKVVLSARSQQDIEKNAAQLRAKGYEAVSFVCNVSDSKQVEELACFAVESYGHFDIWINNAGISGPYGSTLNLTTDQFLNVLRTNIFGVYFGSSTAMRHFVPRRSGKLVNILGQGSQKPAPNQNAYGSSKAWTRVFTLALAREYKNSGVGVYSLQPGLMETDLLTELTTFKAYEQNLRKVMPMLVRAGGKDPDVVARKVLWLVSPATDGKTGLHVHVGSTFVFLIGFFREGFCKLFHIPVRPVDLKVTILPSAFELFDGSEKNV
jgi:glucose 1-dehydrogenase